MLAYRSLGLQIQWNGLEKGEKAAIMRKYLMDERDGEKKLFPFLTPLLSE